MAIAESDEGPRWETAGDPVCWLSRVCPECGALIEPPLPATCWRCGVRVPAP